MFIGRDFAFVHIPKTGGQTVLEMLRNTQGIFYGVQAKFHISVDQCQHKWFDMNKPRIAFVRNPWSWYVSWYFFMVRQYKTALFDAVSNGGEADFETTINNLFDLTEGKRDDLLMKYHDNEETCRIHYIDTDRKNDFSTIIESGDGLFAWNYYTLLFGGKDKIDYTNVTVGKMENLKQDLLKFFVDNNILEENSDDRRKQFQYNRFARMANHPFKRNVAKNYTDYKEHYTPELIERVREKEQYLIDKYDYTF